MRKAFSPLLVGITAALLLGLAGGSHGAEFAPGLEQHLETLRADEPVSVILIMRDQAPVSELNDVCNRRRATRRDRHERVVTALREASIGQRNLLAALSTRAARGDVIGYTSYWVSNLIVAQVTKSYLYELARRDDIEVIEPNFTVSLIEPVAVRPAEGAQRGIGVTPGLRAINADRVWEELGITGAGTLIAGCDTGVDGNHQALADRWRGNWHPASECWLNLIDNGHPNFPHDDGGHGTHTMGTMTGLSVETGDTIGVAWDAHWIATDPIEQPVNPGFDNDIITAFQWFADPDGDPGTVDDVPDVVQNSWRVNEGFPGGYEDCDSRWWDVIDHCEAMGIVTCWSAGNEGPDWETIGSPADRITTPTNSFSVGAVDATNYDLPYPLADFSSRGPSGCDGVTKKPEVAAPGVQVYSSTPGDNYSEMDGTSMAGPHVAGVVALMRQANPDLAVDTIKQILMDTAVDHGRPGEDHEYGWGVIDAYAAVSAVLSGYGTVVGDVTNASNGDTPIPWASVTVEEAECQAPTMPDGTYRISLPPGTYTLHCAHPSFTPASASNVTVVEDEETVQDFSLVDIGGPEITGTTDVRSTDDPSGPYVIETTVTDFSAISSVSLHYQIDEGAWNAAAMTPGGDDLYSYAIPGQAYITHVRYYVSADDIVSNASFDPPAAPTEVYDFWVLPADRLFEDDLEMGAPDWTHDVVLPDYLDQWHLSTERNHTPDGQTSWKCGDPFGGDYAELLDAGLVTPEIELGPDAELRFWQWIDAQESYIPNVTFDGGLVEISVNEGPFEQIFPEGGYTHWIRAGNPPGPFADRTEVFAGQHDWHEVIFSLSGYEGPARLRFRFGSNANEGAEGWYVDDVAIDGFVFDYSAAEGGEAAAFRWLGADPNPFLGGTVLRYELASRSRVLLEVFDLSGRRLRVLTSGVQEAGIHGVTWDGRDGDARPVGSGVYLTRLKAGSGSAVGRMVRIR